MLKPDQWRQTPVPVQRPTDFHATLRVCSPAPYCTTRTKTWPLNQAATIDNKYKIRVFEKLDSNSNLNWANNLRNFTSLFQIVCRLFANLLSFVWNESFWAIALFFIYLFHESEWFEVQTVLTGCRSRGSFLCIDWKNFFELSFQCKHLQIQIFFLYY